MTVIRRASAIVALSGLFVFAIGGATRAQSYNSYGLNQQMSPPYTNYSRTFPTYQPAPTIGGFQQTYNPTPGYSQPGPVYTPPPTYPKYLAPGVGCISRIGPGC